MIIIGERLNSSRPAVRDALARRNQELIVEQARLQVQAGAVSLDLNAAALLTGEKEALRWAIPIIQDAVNVPIAVDTPDPEAMDMALKVHRGRAILNSLTGQENQLKRLLPLVREHNPQVIVLCLDEQGPAATAERALAIARRLSRLLIDQGVAPQDIFVDPLLRPLATDRNAVIRFLESLRLIRQGVPGVRTVAGVSNASFGLPQRRLLNRSVLILSVQAGLEAAICDPLDPELRAALTAAEALLNRDPALDRFR